MKHPEYMFVLAYFLTFLGVPIKGFTSTPQYTSLSPLFNIDQRLRPYTKQQNAHLYQRTRESHILNSSLSDSFDNKDLSIDKISEILELTFIEACMQLATGYVDVLKLFLATLKAAYNKKIPIPELTQCVAEMDTKRMSANRPLTHEEISLRTLWFNIAYLTLESLERIENKKEHIAFHDDVDKALKETLSVSLETRRTYTLIIDEKVMKYLGREVIETQTPSTPGARAEAAMLTYSLKIIDVMLAVVNDERLANENNSGLDGNGIGPPRPNIPGAF